MKIYVGGRRSIDDPTKAVLWSKDGSPIVNAENRFLFGDNGHKLTIINVLTEDSGVYYIEEVNATSRPLSTQINLRVSSKCPVC